MRVIGGSKKGQPLQAVPGHTTRPTTDKVKESLFNLIGYPNISGGIALDLYAGTGALGIEALSRGLVDKVIFIDHDRKAIEIIKQNLERTSFVNQSEVYKNDALRALKVLCKRELSFSFIFLDPPYERQNIASELAIIDSHGLLLPNGIIVVETMKEASLPNQIGQLELEKHKFYGETDIRIYRKGSNLHD